MGKFFNLNLRDINYKIRRPRINNAASAVAVAAPDVERVPYVSDRDKAAAEASVVLAEDQKPQDLATLPHSVYVEKYGVEDAK